MGKCCRAIMKIVKRNGFTSSVLDCENHLQASGFVMNALPMPMYI